MRPAVHVHVHVYMLKGDLFPGTMSVYALMLCVHHCVHASLMALLVRPLAVQSMDVHASMCLRVKEHEHEHEA